MEVSETRYEIKVEKDKSDTLRIRVLKRDSMDKEVYRELTYWSRGVKFQSIEYYRDITGLFYQEVNSEDSSFIQTYETFLKDKKHIDRAKMESKFRGEKEPSVDIRYEYKRSFLGFGKKKTLNIYSTQDTLTNKLELTYNNEEKLIKDILYVDQTEKDTFQLTEYTYVNSKLKSSSYLRLFGSKSELNAFYDDKEQLVSESELVYGIDRVKVEENWDRKYYYDDTGLLISTIEKEIISDTENHYIYEYENIK